MNIVAPTMASNSSMRDLHRNIGHLPPSAIMHLAKNGLLGDVDLDGLRKDVFKTEDCKDCMEAKGTSEAKSNPSPRGGPAGESVHTDINGPLQHSEAGMCYSLGVVVGNEHIYTHARPIIHRFWWSLLNRNSATHKIFDIPLY